MKKDIFLLALLVLFVVNANLFAQTDPNEPNNAFSTATTINYGIPIQNVYIDPANDIDFYKLSANSLDSIRINMSIAGLSQLDGKLMLFSADTTALTMVDKRDAGEDESIIFVIPTAGIYYISATYWETDPLYVPIVGGSHSILRIANRELQIDKSEIRNSKSEIQNPKSEIKTNPKLQEITGKYSISVEYLGKGTSPPIDNNEPNNNFANATLISYGNTLNAVIYPMSDVDYYKFPATIGDSIKIDLLINGISELNGSLSLFNSSGREILVSNHSLDGGNESIIFKIPTTETYYIKILCANPDASTNIGKYSVSLKLLGTVPISILCGTVTDFSTGAFIQSANIKVKEPTLDIYLSNIELTTTTNANGYYSLLIPQGFYYLTISKDGYQLANFYIRAKDGNTVIQNAKLLNASESAVYTNSFESGDDRGEFSTSGPTKWVKTRGFVYGTTTVTTTVGDSFLVVGGRNGYYANEYSWWITSPVDLTTFASATVSFKLWIDSEVNYDYFYVLGNQPAFSQDRFFYLDTNGDGVGDKNDGFSGSSNGWITVTGDLTRITGAKEGYDVRVGFLFVSDNTNQRGFGCAIDSVVIKGYGYALTAPDNFKAVSFQDKRVTLSWDAHPARSGTFETMFRTLNDNEVVVVGDRIMYHGIAKPCEINWDLTSKAEFILPYNKTGISLNESGGFVKFNILRKRLSSGSSNWDLIGSTTDFTYIDYNVVNREVYRYFAVAVYGGGTSPGSTRVIASPGTAIDLPLPISENFEGTAPNFPTGWIPESKGTNDWSIGSKIVEKWGWTGETDSTDYVYMDDYSAGSTAVSNSFIASPMFDATNVGIVHLKFKHFYKHYGADVVYVTARVSYGTWKVLATYNQSTNGWEDVTIDASAIVAGQSHAQIGFRYVDNDDRAFGWAIDDVQILAVASGNVSGTVVNKDTSNPLPYTTIKLTKDNFSKTTTTNTLGQYKFTGIPPGQYNISASLFNMVDENKSVTVVDKQTSVVDFSLGTIYPPPTNLKATAGHNRVDLSWTSPVPFGELKYDDGISESSLWFGTTGADSAYYAVKFTVPTVGDFKLTNVGIYSRQIQGVSSNLLDITIVGTDKNGLPNLNDVLGKVISPNLINNDWTYINLINKNISVNNSKDFCVLLHYPNNKGGPVLYADITNPNNRSYKYYKGSGGWKPVVDSITGGNIDIMVRSYITSGDLTLNYNILRGTSPGNYSSIATNIQETSYIDNSVVDGTTYYYVVSAIYNSIGISPYSNEVSASPEGSISLPFATNLESDNGGFSGDSIWEWGTPTSTGGPNTAKSGTKVWGTDLDSTYKNNLFAYLISPAFDLLNVSGKASVSFNLWYELEITDGTPFDFGYFMIDHNNDGKFNTIATYKGESNGWLNLAYSIPDSLISDYVKFAFAIKTDAGTVKRGMFIDDFIVSTSALPIIDTNPDSIIFTMKDKSDTTIYLTISNSGSSELSYNIETKYTNVITIPGASTPDDFGYVWIDSDKQNGPVFNWVDISLAGTPISLGDDEGKTVSLPFAFPFYGENKTSVTISSNGYLTFGNNGSSFENTQIPNQQNPNDLIAVFWNDLFISLNSSIYRYYDVINNSFVVQYNKVSNQAGDGLYDFQVILYSNGNIVFQYLNMKNDLNSATIGIENKQGNDGLQIAYNTSYIHNNLAVKIIRPNRWISVSSVSGVVSPVSQIQVGLNINASKLSNGLYTAYLNILNNSANSPNVMIPIKMMVDNTATSIISMRNKSREIPSEFKLLQNYPNPFNPETVISYQLPGIGNQVSGNQVLSKQVIGGTTDYRLPITDYHVKLSIYNITGQLIRTLVNEEQTPGYYSVRWDGRDDNGNEVSSGLYIYAIKVGNYTAMKRMIIAK